MRDLWLSLPVWAQDAGVFAALILPVVLIAATILTGHAPGQLTRALLVRHWRTNLLFVLLVGVSLGLGVGVIAQERGLRQGTAQAADKFDLVITAPGSEVTMLLATVFLQPVDAPLLDGSLYNEIANHERVAMAAPLAYGDSWQGHGIVGTTADFVDHLSGGLAEGRVFAAEGEIVLGVDVPLGLGDEITPAHGHGPAAEEDVHGEHLVAVGRMARTGTPWDRAILTPVEGVWETHVLPRGHAPEDGEVIGPPFDPDYFPGTPAIIVRADELWSTYGLRNEFTRSESMAFFPGTVLAQLYALMGDVRQVMSVMAVVTQILVALGVLTALAILARLFARRMAVLRALGAPERFIFAVIWGYAAVLMLAGAALGLLIGVGATAAISAMLTARTGIALGTGFGWTEAQQIAAFLSASLILALGPAAIAMRRPIVADLRG
ncbi:ABC transporter permease [Rhodobacterales bacterium HKCCE3408]|nr:ABC transporter permease [Rhodobacterales bacterium HKCCE3408]